MHIEENSTSSRELGYNEVTLYLEINDHTSYTECFYKFNLSPFIKSKGLNIYLLASYLKSLGFQLEGRSLSYYCLDAEMYVNLGVDPIHPDYHINLDEIQEQLCLRSNLTNISIIHMMMSEEMNEAVNKIKEVENVNDDNNENDGKKVCRRTKERRIGFIIEKVAKWREYYNGVPDQNQNSLKRYSLDDAAKMVGISKKSLDDYLLQIRYGRKFGFNFNEHKNEKVGVLRTFVKKHNQGISKRKKKDEKD